MSRPLVTSVRVVLPADREPALREGFRALVEAGLPDGVVRTQLLRGQDGAWRIDTTWRDQAAVLALRAAGRPPAALALLDRLGGVEHTHAVFTVEDGAEP